MRIWCIKIGIVLDWYSSSGNPTYTLTAHSKDEISKPYSYLVISHQKHYVVKYLSDSTHKYPKVESKKLLWFLIDNIFVLVGVKVFQQSVGIPMGTNCALLLADMFLYSYEA
jgi:hypothetical protein